MSYSNDIRTVLDIQDLNITFEENCIKEGRYKGKPCKYITGKLTYDPTHCEACGFKNKDYTIYKNGTQISRITLPITGIHPTYLLLHKQRFKCKACDSSFTAKTPIVKKSCYISSHVKSQVIIKASEARSLKSIALDCCVAPTTVQREINEASKLYRPCNQALPKHLSFDEFKYAKGTLAFEYINAVTGDILDILERRDGRTIKDHFNTNYNLTQRQSVETVTIDMNASYVNIIKELFPNAQIIIDRFHLVQLINRSMNKCRIKVMNELKKSNSDHQKRYRRLKRYWKLFLKKEADVTSTEYNYYPLFGQRLESSIIEEMLAYSPVLRENYELYQALLSSMSERDFVALESILKKPVTPLLTSAMKTSLKTLKKHLPFIKNSFIFPYNNGRIEGINNKIKVLNRVAYGYRNFMNYKKRIILHFRFRIIDLKPIEKTTKKPRSKAA